MAMKDTHDHVESVGRYRFERQLVVGCLVGLLTISAVSQLYWVHHSSSPPCTTAMCHQAALRALNAASAKETPALKDVHKEVPLTGPLADLAKEDPEACVELSESHLEMEFVREGACWKRHQVQGILIMLIKTFHELLTKLKVTHWIDSATLLGAVRHGGIVPYDIDADFGIDQAGYEYLRDTKVDVPDWFALHVWNTTVNGADHRDEWIPIRFIHNVSGIYIDTFVFLEEEDYYGRTLMGPARSGAFGSCDKCIKGDDGKGHFLIPSEWVYPLERCRFEDFIVPCPKEAAKYLEFMFGPDYRTPVQ